MVEVTPVIMPVRDRPELTLQAIQSLLTHTDCPFELILIDDASTDPQTLDLLYNPAGFWDEAPIPETCVNIRVVKMATPTHHGACKNAGAAVMAPSAYVYFSDNDVYFAPGWLSTLLSAAAAFPQVGVLGGDRHPWHPVEQQLTEGGMTVETAYTQVGYSMLISQEVWRTAGPFIHMPLHDYGNDDVRLCERVKKLGFLTGAVSPRVIYHCGLTKTNGEPALGADLFAAQAGPARVLK